jgi:hypothetical protein
MKWEAGTHRISTLPISPVTLEARQPLLLGRCSHQPRKSCSDANMVYSQAERMFVLEYYFAKKSLAAVREVFCNAYPNKKVRSKITPDWEQNFGPQKVLNCNTCCSPSDKAAEITAVQVKCGISCNNGIRMQGFNITNAVALLCMAGFMNRHESVPKTGHKVCTNINPSQKHGKPLWMSVK